MKKILIRTSLVLLALVVVIFIYMFITFVPIMTGMAAKTMCSCVFVMHREPESVVAKELTVVPGLSSAKVLIDQAAHTVTASLLGRTSKSIYREGLGCTLLADRSEEELRSQSFSIPPPPAHVTDSIAWPTGDKTPDSLRSDVNYSLVNEAIDSAFVDVDPNNPVNTLAVAIVYDGNLIGERYAAGINKNSLLMGWSMTKSITNAMVGLLVKDGKLAVDAPAPVSEWQQDERKAITLNNLLQASSGLKWSESYFLPGDFHNMFIHSDDKAAYAASKKLGSKPNDYFEYSSGTTNILSRIVRQTIGDPDYHRFVYERLFYKIGMNHTLLEPDASGTFVGSSYGYASARDWARFGLLYLNDGVWNGERILPEGWVKYSSTPATGAPLREYGAQWWLNAGAKENPAHCHEPGLPGDALMAEGFERQYVIVIPSRKLVVVRLGVTHNRNFNVASLVNKVIRALP